MTKGRTRWLRSNRWRWLSGGLILMMVAGLWLLPGKAPSPSRPSSYLLAQQADFNRLEYYATPAAEAIAVTEPWYCPTAAWVGRLILPEVAEYEVDPGDWVWLEVQHAPQPDLIGQHVKLTWQPTPEMQAYLNAVTVDVTFGEAAARSLRQGEVVPTRLNRRRQVGPLQSLAGARPQDDLLVSLKEVQVQTRGSDSVLAIREAPVQIGGRRVALVKLVDTVPRSPVPADCPGESPCPSDYFRVRHYNPKTGQFDGLEAVVRIPQQPRDRNGRFLSTPHDLTASPAGTAGWYLYGAFDTAGTFTVQSLQPRSLMQVQPDQVVLGTVPALNFITWQNWRDLPAQKGTVERVLLSTTATDADQAVEQWRLGDRGLVIHLFGGIGGELAESGTPGTVTGHFAYGIAEVVRDRFTDELQFQVTYHQIYAHNPNAIVSGVADWSAYTGHLERGWLGARPISDVIVKLDIFTEPFDLGSHSLSLFDNLLDETLLIAARYRTGDGTGVAAVTPATSCVQDSSQALYIAIETVKQQALDTPEIADWLSTNPQDPGAARFWKFVGLGRSLVRLLTPYGVVRHDWQHNAEALAGVNRRNGFVSSRSLVNTLLSWRSMMPRRAHDDLNRIFLEHGAQLWFLRTNQVGGRDPSIEPTAPTLLFGKWPIIGTLIKRLTDAVTVPLTARVWLMTLGALGLYGALALAYGWRSGFLHASATGISGFLHPGWLLKLFVMPALLEEVIFRVFLLPHPIEGVSMDRWILWAMLSLGLFVLYHPLNAWILYPPGRGVFGDGRFLCLAGLLALICTAVYGLTGSLWAIALMHWIVVTVWLKALGGQQRLYPQSARAQTPENAVIKSSK